MTSVLSAPRSLLDGLQVLTSPKSSAATSAKSGQDAPDPFEFGGSPQREAGNGPSFGSSRHTISPQTLSALIDAQAQSGSTDSAPANPPDALQTLFSQLDADGDGSITKSEVEDAVGRDSHLAAADDVFGELDADGDGSVSLDELKSYSDHHLHAVLTDLADETKSDGSTGSSTNPAHPGELTILDNVQFTVLPIDLTTFVNSAVYHASLGPSADAIVRPVPVELHPQWLR